MKKSLAFILLLSLGLPASAESEKSKPIKPSLRNDTLIFDHFIVSFERTLRIPDDGKQYPLPPSLGSFPIYPVKAYAKKLPKEWVKEGGYFIPMYQREAMWISFGGEHWRPRAVKIGIGNINALTGIAWDPILKKQKTQDYLVAPTPQPWIDGIKAGKNYIRQFVAMPLGKGYTVEGQITGEEKVGGLQIVVYNPKDGKFKKPADEGKGRKSLLLPSPYGFALKSVEEGEEMGLAAGGKMTQKIYPDPHGIGTWDPNAFGIVHLYIVNSALFKKITGKEPPETPITKKEYELAGYPWFGLYDEKYSDIRTSEKLGKIKSVGTIDKKKGTKSADEKSMTVKKVIKYKVPQTEKEAPPNRKPEQETKKNE